MRTILRRTLAPRSERGLGSRIRQRFAEEGGIDLELPSREGRPRAAKFEEG